MFRKTLTGLFAFLLGSSLPAQPPDAAMTWLGKPFAKDPKRFLYRWDGERHALLLYRNVNDRDEPAIRAYEGALRLTTTIVPLKDFADGKSLSVWSAAAGPEGHILLVGVLQRDKDRLSHVLLTYDRNGKLLKVWDVLPYHHHAIAAGQDGSVFAFGHRVDRKERDPVYPLLIKYSSHGTIVGEYLLSSEFPTGADVLDGGLHQLEVWGDRVILFVGGANEVIQLTQRGKLGRRLRLADLHDLIAVETGTKAVALTTFAQQSGAEGFVAQALAWSKEASKQGSRTVLRISRDMTAWSRVEGSDTPADTPFVGLDQDRLLFLKVGADGETAVLRKPF